MMNEATLKSPVLVACLAGVVTNQYLTSRAFPTETS
jgi:hypothetical protein